MTKGVGALHPQVSGVNVESLVDLGDEAFALAADLWSGATSINVAVGSDHTGVLRVVIDRSGGVREILLDESWIDEIDPRHLGAAVLSAFHDGQRKRLGAWGAGRSNRAGRGTNTDATSVDNAAEAIVSHASPQMSREEAERQKEQLRVAFSLEVTGRAPSGRAEIKAVGPSVKAVKLDEHWLRQADHEEIGREVTRAFNSLYTRMPNEVVNALAPSAVSTELAQLAAKIEDLRQRATKL
jgi:DNA-binding protein YbaB